MSDILNETLDFVFFPTDPRRFIPVDFCHNEGIVSQFDTSNSLPLTPMALSILFSEPIQLTNRSTDRKSLKLLYLTDNLEEHGD